MRALDVPSGRSCKSACRPRSARSRPWPSSPPSRPSSGRSAPVTRDTDGRGVRVSGRVSKQVPRRVDPPYAAHALSASPPDAPPRFLSARRRVCHPRPSSCRSCACAGPAWGSCPSPEASSRRKAPSRLPQSRRALFSGSREGEDVSPAISSSQRANSTAGAFGTFFVIDNCNPRHNPARARETFFETVQTATRRWVVSHPPPSPRGTSRPCARCRRAAPCLSRARTRITTPRRKRRSARGTPTATASWTRRSCTWCSCAWGSSTASRRRTCRR